MSDFLTRLVTATYQPAATVRPRPVAHYEPIGAVLPLWLEGEETSPTAPIVAAPRQAPVAPASVPAKATTLPPPMPNAPVAPTLRAVTPASAPLVTPSEVAAPLAAQTPKTIQPPPLPPITTAEAPALSPQPSAQPLPRAPLMAPPHPLPAPPRPPRREDAAKREDAPRAAPTLAQGVVTPLLIQVITEPGATQPAPLPQRSAPPPAAEPVSALRKPLAAVQTVAPLPIAPSATESEAHHATPMRTRPADAFATRPQPRINTPSLAAPAPAPPAVPAPPVIRVTIGRIVIKAEGGKPSKLAKPHPAPAKPGLSLDAYLKSRRGGDA